MHRLYKKLNLKEIKMNGFSSEIQTKSPVSSTRTKGEELETTTTESEQIVTVIDTTETQTKDGIII